MAKKQPQTDNKPKYQCKDCKNSYDWHSQAHDGSLILCRCKYKKDGGKYCIFLTDSQCENFIRR